MRKILIASPLDPGRFARIAVLAPHQDDELIGAGGLCELARQAGVALRIIYLTDGAERGMPGKDGRELGTDQAALVRQDEARAVCRELGADYACLDISNLTVAPERTHLEVLAGHLDEFRPNLIATPWLFDSAPKHRMATHLLWLAGRIGRLHASEIWGYQVNNGLVANGVLDITAVMDRKLELIRIYRSQNEFLRRYDHQAMGLGAWNSRYLQSKGAALSETFAELFLTLPTAEFESLVARHYFPDLATVYQGNKKLIGAMSRLHEQVVGDR